MSDGTVWGLLDQLEQHPFTLIGLADREKFHTGMMAFTINSLSGTDKAQFLEALWDCSVKEISSVTSEVDACEALVEVSSVDLQIVDRATSQVKAKPILWAEVKVKTNLAGHQLQKYANKHVQGVRGALLQVFGSTESYDNVAVCAFPSKVVEFFAREDWAEYFPDLESHRVSLIKLWVDYLNTFSKLISHFESVGLGELCTRPKEIEARLRKLKLVGIFGHYRIQLFWSKLNDCKEVGNLLPREAHLFNSHGNAGLDLPWSVDLSGGGEEYVHLQWQAGSLKLAAVSQETNSPGKIEAIQEIYQSGGGSGFENKRISKGKFQSITLEKWNVFEPIGEEQFNVFEQWLRCVDGYTRRSP